VIFQLIFFVLLFTLKGQWGK